MKHFAKPLAAIALLITPLPALAQAEEAPVAQSAEQTVLEMRADEVVALFNGNAEPEDIFSAAFLAQVSADQFRTIAKQITGQFGSALAVETLDNPAGPRSAIAIRMERAIAKGTIGVGADGKVNELLLQTFDPVDDSVAKIETDLEALPGEVSWWFAPLDGSAPVLSGNPEDQMALGSTFKLYVLATLAREVAEGKRAWNDTVTLPDTRSFPSGMMQDWPGNAPVTLMTLANLMISISDNTATDALIDVLGRDAIEATLVESGHSDPALNMPFMKTRDMFLLKAGTDDRLNAYREGDTGERLSILESIETPVLSLDEVSAAFAGDPIALDVEWFASAADLSALFRFMRETADPRAFEVMAINSGANEGAREGWDYIGYKGGSEPGVLNFTWLLTDEAGRDHVLVLSWNNPEANVDLSALNLIAMRILAL